MPWKAKAQMYVTSKSSTDVLERPFLKMGARVKFGQPETSRWVRTVNPVALDVRNDSQGEFFLVSKQVSVTVEILEVKPKERHLVLLTRVPDGFGGETKSRFLLGHDERHWFVAAIPERSPVTTVAAAKQALKPEQVVRVESALKNKLRQRRITRARIRQGEWFFVPAPSLKVDPKRTFKNEPLRRGGGKPHVCQELYREGGETVYISRLYPNGLSVAEYRRLSEKQRKETVWRTMTRNPHVYVRGTVRHSDHKTIFLAGWHEVFVNTETQAAAMRNVAFLD
jgi:hypothetical protein